MCLIVPHCASSCFVHVADVASSAANATELQLLGVSKLTDKHILAQL